MTALLLYGEVMAVCTVMIIAVIIQPGPEAMPPATEGGGGAQERGTTKINYFHLFRDEKAVPREFRGENLEILRRILRHNIANSAAILHNIQHSAEILQKFCSNYEGQR